MIRSKADSHSCPCTEQERPAKGIELREEQEPAADLAEAETHGNQAVQRSLTQGAAACDPSNPDPSNPEEGLRLQGAVGNSAVAGLLQRKPGPPAEVPDGPAGLAIRRPPPLQVVDDTAPTEDPAEAGGAPEVQLALAVGRADDPLEREADTFAQRVVQRAQSGSGPPPTGEPCDDCKRELPIQRAGGGAVPGVLSGQSARTIERPGAGSPLSPGMRARLEPTLGERLEGVRVHQGPDARTTAKELGARAFTFGENVWLGGGESSEDLRLMAHETTHVVQQRNGGSIARRLQRTPETEEEPKPPPAENGSTPSGGAPAGQPPAPPPAAEGSATKTGAPPGDEVAIPKAPAPPAQPAGAQTPPAKAPAGKQPSEGKGEATAKAGAAPEKAGGEHGEAGGGPAPAALPTVALSVTPSSDFGQYASQALTTLSASASQELGAIQSSAESARAEVRALFAAAQQQASGRIAAARSQLAAASQATEQQAVASQAEQSSQLVAETSAQQATVTQEGQRAGQEGEAAKTAEGASTRSSMEGSARSAKESGEARGSESGGMLGALKAIAVTFLGEQIAAAISAAISAVIAKLGELIADLIGRIMRELEQALAAVGEALSSTLSALGSLGSTFLQQLGIARGDVESGLAQAEATTRQKLSEGLQTALAGIADVQAGAAAKLTEVYTGVASIVDGLVAGDVSLSEDEDVEAPDQALYGALDQVLGDGLAALAAVRSAFDEAVARQVETARSDVDGLLAKLDAELGALTGRVQGGLQSASGSWLGALGGLVSGALGALGGVVSAIVAGVTSALTGGKSELKAAADEPVSKAEKADSPEAFDTIERKTSSWYDELDLTELAASAGSAVGLQRSFIGGVGSELWDLVSGLFMAIVGLLAVASIPVIGPPLAVLLLVGFVLYGLAEPFLRVWDKLGKAGLPTWAKIILTPFIGFADLVGALPLIEGLVGYDLLTGDKLSDEEAGRRFTRGLIDLILTFGTAGIGRVIKAGVKPAARGAAKASRWVDDGIRALIKWFKGGKKAGPKGAKGGKPKKPSGKGKGKGDDGAGAKKGEKPKIPEDLAGLCRIGSVLCNDIPAKIKSEAGGHPQGVVPEPKGPFDIKRSALNPAKRTGLKKIALDNADRWPHFKKALEDARKAGHDFPFEIIKGKKVEWQVHHSKPVQFGGDSSIGNLYPIPASQHYKYSAYWSRVYHAIKGRFSKSDWNKIYTKSTKDVKDIPPPPP